MPRLLALLARDEADYDVEGRSGAVEPPSPQEARAFLENPDVLFFVAEQDGFLAGFLWCQAIRRRHDGSELLLYEIGVRSARRREGIGRMLVEAMDAWMSANQVIEVWVLADNDGAVEFYRACGFDVVPGPAIYMTRVTTPA